jgi:carbonic anhydrase
MGGSLLLRMAALSLAVGSALGCGMEFVEGGQRLGGLPRDRELAAHKLGEARRLNEAAQRRRLSGYNGKLHGEDWPEEWVGCGGASQSPVNLPTFAQIMKDGTEINLSNSAPGADNANLTKLEKLALSWPAGLAYAHSNGYTVQAVSTGTGVTRTTGLNHLAYASDRSYDTNGENYTLDHIHFHWGTAAQGNNVGSEHFSGNKSFPMEGHFVHYNTKYGSVAAAAGQLDGLFVIGTFFSLSKIANAGLAPIVAAIPGLVDTKVKTNMTLDFAKILSPAVDFAKYVAYGGSLTSPGCFQTVTFAILDAPAPISQAQLDAFRNLPGVNSSNWRELQPIHGRRFFTATQSIVGQDPVTLAPTTAKPTPPTAKPTTAKPTPPTAKPTTAKPTPPTAKPTTAKPTPPTATPTTAKPTPPTAKPTTTTPTTAKPTTAKPTSKPPIMG